MYELSSSDCPEPSQTSAASMSMSWPNISQLGQRDFELQQYDSTVASMRQYGAVVLFALSNQTQQG